MVSAFISQSLCPQTTPKRAPRRNTNGKPYLVPQGTFFTSSVCSVVCNTNTAQSSQTAPSSGKSCLQQREQGAKSGHKSVGRRQSCSSAVPVSLRNVGHSDSHTHGLSPPSRTLPATQHTHVVGRASQEDKSWLPRGWMEGGGTDLHGFEGGDEGQHDVVTRAAGAGQQRTAPAEREENRERLSKDRP